MSIKVYTVGTSKKSAEEFFGILKKTSIEKIIDIRLNNKSQLLGFSKGQDLKYFCEKCHHIKYEYVPLLAPTKELLEKYQKDKDWSFYEIEFFQILDSRPTMNIFQKACGDVKNVCLLCSEPTPRHCHRRLVAEYLAKHNRGIKIIHL